MSERFDLLYKDNYNLIVDKLPDINGYTLEWLNQEGFFLLQMSSSVIFADLECDALFEKKTFEWIVALYHLYIDFVFLISQGNTRTDFYNLSDAVKKYSFLYKELDKSKVYENILLKREKIKKMLFYLLQGSSIKILYFMAGYFSVEDGLLVRKEGSVSSPLPQLDDIIRADNYELTRTIIPVYLWIKSGVKLLCTNNSIGMEIQ